jgi:homoserine kinase
MSSVSEYLAKHDRYPGLKLVLPATSANLGPGFDTAGLALSMHLTIEAQIATDFEFRIEASGRDAELCAVVEDNLIFETYKRVLIRTGSAIPKLHLKIHNEIPLGMGCGSSAAALLAGVALASHFGGLNLNDTDIVDEASLYEGHPDNVAACWLGGFTVSADVDGVIETASFACDPSWQMLLAVQASSLATKKARALLPESYSKADTIFNVQRASLLTAAFAQGRLDLLKTAMQDRMHQPHRLEVCPLLKQLLPLANAPEFAGIALSGAGPSVLVFVGEGTTAAAAEAIMRSVLDPAVEILSLRIASGATKKLL